jgi:uncharacterized protein YdcH (DUF465 family)
MELHEFVNDIGQLSLEDLSVMKLMKEIMKLDSQINMKKR